MPLVSKAMPHDYQSRQPGTGARRMFGPSRNGNDGYDPGAYGRAVAAVYDDLYSTVPETDEAVEVLAELAGEDGVVLEMGIGTGRLALPLAGRGIAVAGIEGSEEMVDEL